MLGLSLVLSIGFEFRVKVSFRVRLRVRVVVSVRISQVQQPEATVRAVNLVPVQQWVSVSIPQQCAHPRFVSMLWRGFLKSFDPLAFTALLCVRGTHLHRYQGWKSCCA